MPGVCLKVLFPLDGSEVSYDAMVKAIRMLKEVPGLQLTALNVRQDMEGAPEHLIEQTEEDPDDEVFPTPASSQKALERAVELAQAEGVKLRTLSQMGNTSEIILKEAAQYDLLVMHALGRSNLRDLFRLSATEKIARRAPCGVLLVPTKS